MAQVTTEIGPEDHGRVMSLNDFKHAKGQEGYLYELGRGRVVVMDVPTRTHLAQVDATRLQLDSYHLEHKQVIHQIAGGRDVRLVLEHLQSQRHPDVVVYKHPPDAEENRWGTWIPEIVIEVVSPRSSETRDYEEKPEEYLLFGVREYWIMDAARKTMTILQRRVGGKWKDREIRPPELYRTRLLPDLEFDCGAVFTAARAAGK